LSSDLYFPDFYIFFGGGGSVYLRPVSTDAVMRHAIGARVVIANPSRADNHLTYTVVEHRSDGKYRLSREAATGFTTETVAGESSLQRAFHIPTLADIERAMR